MNFDILLLKLYKYRIKGAELIPTSGAVLNTHIKIPFNIKSTDTFSCLMTKTGKPQRSILFLLYINDLPSCVVGSKLFMLADHTIAIFESKDPEYLEIKSI